MVQHPLPSSVTKTISVIWDQMLWNKTADADARDVMYIKSLMYCCICTDMS